MSDGRIALGRVIPRPQQPTATLASFTDQTTFAVPAVQAIIEKCDGSSVETEWSHETKLFAKFLDIAKSSIKPGNRAEAARYKVMSFDYELRLYNEAFAQDTLKAVEGFKAVRNHTKTDVTASGGSKSSRACAWHGRAARLRAGSAK